MPVNIISTPSIETWRPPANASGTPIDFAQIAEQPAMDTPPTRGLMERLAESRASRLFAWGSTLACALTVAGTAGSRNSEKTGEKTAIAATGDLNGPVIQFFEATTNASASPLTMEYISGIQAYLNKRGNGTRARVATTNGNYDVQPLKINGTTSTWQELLKQAVDEIKRRDFDTQDNMNIVYLPESLPQPSGCGLSSIEIPERVAINSLKKACFTGRREGFSLSDVEAVQDTLFATRTTGPVGDKLDTMYQSLPGWLWMNTSLNHSGTYADTLGSNKLFQSRVLAPKPTGGTLSFSPQPDKCAVDCGDGYLFPTQTNVSITAKPNEDMKFKGWTGACAEDKDNVCEITTNNLQPTEASAVFEQVPSPQPKPKIVYKVTAESKGPGRVKIGTKVARKLVSMTNKKNRILVITPVPNKNAFFSREYGCDNLQLKKAAATAINKCYELQDNKKERVVLIFKKEKEIVK